jgi:hypothetical protein
VLAADEVASEHGTDADGRSKHATALLYLHEFHLNLYKHSNKARPDCPLTVDRNSVHGKSSHATSMLVCAAFAHMLMANRVSVLEHATTTSNAHHLARELSRLCGVLTRLGTR